MGGIYLGAKITFSCALYCMFFCSNYVFFLPHDYACLFRRVGRYDGAFGF